MMDFREMDSTKLGHLLEGAGAVVVRPEILGYWARAIRDMAIQQTCADFDERPARWKNINAGEHKLRELYLEQIKDLQFDLVSPRIDGQSNRPVIDARHHQAIWGEISRLRRVIDLIDEGPPLIPEYMEPPIHPTRPRDKDLQTVFRAYVALTGKSQRSRNGPAMRFIAAVVREVWERSMEPGAIFQRLWLHDRGRRIGA
jgi:hypothetical protein